MVSLNNKMIVNEMINRDPLDSHIYFEVIEKSLPNQYSISGWFKWKNTDL